ncbi:DUF6333 family protein [Streptomyces sp. MB09-02B]|uniref:DUF6333 family protein n=1 Tax=Streptomyces sp. MB09-02B TaxID=3028667 RepID=UPI0029B803EB|nr:DUF6333 family protein [Streptomyces sp. MB09-02B]MDX3640110.1 DUF6333 family protein [Streptomyces sp. MB09-02B]
MTDDSFWTLPPDRVVRGSMGHCDLTVLLPPFDVDAGALPANDPSRAAEFAASLGTVDEILESLGPRPVLDVPPYTDTRSDLDIVHAAAWGHVLGFSGPALADNGNDTPVLSEARVLRERYPDARIVGRVHFHGGADHTEDLVWLPDGAMFHATGWPGDDPFEVTGDPAGIAAALGVPAETLEDLGLDEEDPADIEWSGFAALALGKADPWGKKHLDITAFRVRHSDSATSRMEELYFLGG